MNRTRYPGCATSSRWDPVVRIFDHMLVAVVLAFLTFMAGWRFLIAY